MTKNLHKLPPDLPVPVDDGACDHLPGMEMPPVALPATTGAALNVAEASHDGPAVFFFYPRSGRPDEPRIPGWDDIPGARGCTPQSCAFRDHFSEFEALCRAMIELYQAQGDRNAARSWLDLWAATDPDNPDIAALRRRLGAPGERRGLFGRRS